VAKDKAIWTIFTRSGREIDLLIAAFGQYGDASKARWVEALRVMRMFADEVRNRRD
jgi:hypothetical protein